ncbi:MAG: hypothetical protein J7639_19530, partial [Paenibacillaceae bacterium]|nr:hypothetical protein [Paenibacillaceae bacterium]
VWTAWLPKEDIANMATKDDIANMATKDDIAKLDAKFDILSTGLARVEKKLDVTFEQVVRNSAFTSSLHHKPATVEDNALDIRLLKKLLTR